MQIRRLLQPDGSSLCGQTCVAMAAGVSLDRAIEAVGHRKGRGTYTQEIVQGLRELGIPCADRCKRVSRIKPMMPKRGMIHINRPPGDDRGGKYHWMLVWDGEMYDPAGKWPTGYDHWRITSYLEIMS